MLMKGVTGRKRWDMGLHESRYEEDRLTVSGLTTLGGNVKKEKRHKFIFRTCKYGWVVKNGEKYNPCIIIVHSLK